MIKTTGIELWEIMKEGKNNEVFEVTECTLPQYVGHQLKTEVKHENGKDFRCIVKANSTGDGQDNLAVLYGCLGTATFKKVQVYEEITLIEAIERMENYRLVHFRHMGEYKELTRYDDFSDMHVDDMSDLMNKTFYKKSGE